MKRGGPLARKTPLRAKVPMRKSAPKSTKARKDARGRPCMVRIVGCSGGGEDSILAHYRLAGYCGTGTKPSDTAMAAWCCMSCHDIADARKPAPDGWTREAVRLAHAEGCLRTAAEREKT